MAKKIVRGITDIKTISNQDFDTNNVNDLLSDGQHNYIHRKKGTTEEYHNLTDNLKTVQSDDTDLLEVTNNNDTTNSATLHPKHDTQKEQLLESIDETILIEHGENGTDETTSVDVNFDKVQGKLTPGAGIELNNDVISVKHGEQPTANLNNFITTQFFKPGFNSTNLPQGTVPDGLLTVVRIGDVVEQTYQTYNGSGRFFRSCFQVDTSPHWSDWKKIVTQSDIDTLLAQKQNTITNNTSIGVSGTGLRQLYTLKQSYSHTNGVLKTHVKSVSNNTSVSTAEEEFNFIVKINKGASSASFTLNEHDRTKFNNIMASYGQNNAVRISGLIFTLSGSSLTVSTANSVDHNYVITFSDII